MNATLGSSLALFSFEPSQEALEDIEKFGQEAISQCHLLAFCAFCGRPSDFLGIIRLPSGFIVEEDTPFNLWFGFCNSCGEEFGAEGMRVKILDFYSKEKAAILS